MRSARWISSCFPRYTNVTEVAIYGVAFRYFSMALLLLEAIHAVLLPKFSQPGMQNSEAQRSFLKNWLRFSVWAIIPVILLVFFGKKPFIWLNGPNYANSFYILVILAFGVWLSLMFSPLEYPPRSPGFPLYVFSWACALLTSIIGSLILIPLWHGIGAAIVWSLRTTLCYSFRFCGGSTGDEKFAPPRTK